MAQPRPRKFFKLGPDDEWKHEATPAMGSPAASLSRARVLLAEGRFDRALNMANRWMKRFPTSPLLPEAYLLRGDALVGIGDEYESLYDYEFLTRKYPGSEVFSLALEREYEIAVKYANGLRRKILGFRLIDATDEAEELLIRIQERLPGSGLAEKAGLELAAMYFRNRRMTLAAEAYAIFIERYPTIYRDRLCKAAIDLCQYRYVQRAAVRHRWAARSQGRTPTTRHSPSR